MSEDNSDEAGTVEEARAHLEEEVERLHGVEALAPVVMQSLMVLHFLMHDRGIPPCEVLVMVEALAEHLRLEAQEWVTTATDYPTADRPYQRELVHTRVADVLDKLEDAGVVVAELLQSATLVTVRAEDGHFVIRDAEGRLTDAYEIIRPNSSGPEEMN